jgi:recombinational DNA repair ATPase RecF
MSAKVAAGIRAREAAKHAKRDLKVQTTKLAKISGKVAANRAAIAAKVEQRVDEIAEDEFSGELPE